MNNKLENKSNVIKSIKGITLVSLVLTIIIIIILAVISITFIFGDNGLIKSADDAGKYYTNDVMYTEDSIANVEVYLNELIEERGKKTLVQAFEDGELKVGDYVNYKPEYHESITVGTNETGYTNSKNMSNGTDQTYSQNNDTTWRVLGLSEDGNHLLLISGSPIKKDGDNPYLILEGATGAGNSVNTLNKISSIYHNSTLAEETRSMMLEDFENVLGKMIVEYPIENNGEVGKVYLMKDKEKILIGQTARYSEYIYKEGDYTLTNPPQKAIAGVRIEPNSWMFKYTTEIDGDIRADYIPENIYELLFGETTKSKNYAKSYWLASMGVDCHMEYANFGPGVVYRGYADCGYNAQFRSNGQWFAIGFAVRPVVVLKSNIILGNKEGQLHKIEGRELGRKRIIGAPFSGVHHNSKRSYVN